MQNGRKIPQTTCRFMNYQNSRKLLEQLRRVGGLLRRRYGRLNGKECEERNIPHGQEAAEDGNAPSLFYKKIRGCKGGRKKALIPRRKGFVLPPFFLPQHNTHSTYYYEHTTHKSLFYLNIR